MAGSPALLLLLSLGLCCTGTQGQRMEATFLHRKKQHPQEGQRLELECLNCDRNRPIFWIRLDKSGNLHFILSSTHSYPSTLKEGEKTSPNFEALWKGNSYRLVVKNFRAQDQGTYFCVNYINQVLHFSSGQPAFFPVPTAALTATTQSSQVTTKDISQHSPDPGTSSKNTLNSTCEVFLWVRVAGTCLLLLTAITITIMLCQRPSSP
ncbi:T-cell surface glycoprotein CD8 alpha chain-like isoform X3 [Gallus gallus]|uniref:T-cell surface glycoprotein CD8 alpha chain-like isoform X3 n=1 Tax=Gallus gallus TaxID=9031 RepID=UPI001AE5414D|nr:T-cell surface glycoprotein CD8 alpha chain-like isoform X3 [Gallus gallus]